MTPDYIKFLVLIGVWALFETYQGLQIIVNRKNDHRDSQYYIGINFIISGSMFSILFLICILYVWVHPGLINPYGNNLFAIFVVFWFFLTGFVCGTYGFFNRKAIRNLGVRCMLNFQFFLSLCMFLLVFCLFFCFWLDHVVQSNMPAVPFKA